MNSSVFATFTILTILFLILYSLGFGLMCLLRDTQGEQRTVKALSIRVALSIALFFGLLLAIHQGWIIPNPPAL